MSRLNRIKLKNFGIGLFCFVFLFLSSGCVAVFNNPGSETESTSVSGSSDGSSTVTSSGSYTGFNGWTYVQALGGRTPVTTPDQLSTTSASVTLKWDDVTISGTIASYNIYRSTSSNGYDYDSPLATGITTSAKSYTDNSVSVSTTYYYTVAPVISGTPYFDTSTTDYEVKIIMPPANMVLIHRWMANLEICTLLGETPDRDNNYRCSYSGPGKITGDYYDLEKSYFIDVVEAGCNYTRGTSCSGTVCLGTASPANGVGDIGDVFYDRDGTEGECWYKRDNSSDYWVKAEDATDTELGIMYSNAPGLPPLVYVDQTESNAACEEYTVNSQTKTLMSRKLQFAASSYEESLSNAEIVTLEGASGAYAANGCNTDDGHGTYAGIADNNAEPADYETLPYTATAGDEAYRTGSTSTEACVSRFGIQDLTGNVWEWVSDQINAGSGISSPLVATNTDFNGVDFDDNEASSTSDHFQDDPEVNLALGLPMAAAAPAGWSHEVGGGAGQFDSAGFHGDYFWISTAGSRGVSVGGAWFLGSTAGRFGLNLIAPPSDRAGTLGFRCSAPAE